mmetsp:Transcript_89185/g.158051  ORF Transcript_89185/g.158051 Transcript_89185/m.158051 type:complete len:380 (+) Transcript_89185:23-1162(+)
MTTIEKVKNWEKHGFKQLQAEVLEQLLELSRTAEAANGHRTTDRDWLISVAVLLKQQEAGPKRERICSECCMRLEDGSVCICCDIAATADEQVISAAYSEQVSEGFHAEEERLLKKTQEGLKEVAWALEKSLGKANQFQEELHEFPSARFVEATQAANKPVSCQQEKAQRTDARMQLVQEAKSSLEIMEKMLDTRKPALDRLDEQQKIILESCQKTWTLHKKLALAAEHSTNCRQQDFESSSAEANKRLDQVFQPVLEVTLGRLQDIIQFLQTSEQQISREAGNGKKLYETKLADVEVELSQLLDAGITENVDFKQLQEKKRRLEAELLHIGAKAVEVKSLVAWGEKLRLRLEELRPVERPAKSRRLSRFIPRISFSRN